MGPWGVCTPGKSACMRNTVVLLWDQEFYMPGGKGGRGGTCGGGGTLDLPKGGLHYQLQLSVEEMGPRVARFFHFFFLREARSLKFKM